MRVRDFPHVVFFGCDSPVQNKPCGTRPTAYGLIVDFVKQQVHLHAGGRIRTLKRPPLSMDGRELTYNLASEALALCFIDAKAERCRAACISELDGRAAAYADLEGHKQT